MRPGYPATRRQSAFTLVELTIVVLILAILAALVLPKFSEAAARAEAAQMASNFRLLANAVRRYHAEHGDYPPDQHGGVVPPSLQPYLGSFDMSHTPLGGYWDYEHWPTGSTPFLVAISIRSDPSRFAEVDALLDDGDLTTGGVRQVSRSGVRLQFGIVPR